MFSGGPSVASFPCPLSIHGNNIRWRPRTPGGDPHLPLFLNRHRFLWRLRAPASPDEIRRVERWLAAARVFLALSAVVSIWLDPSDLNDPGSNVPRWMLRIFIAHSVVVMLLLRWRRESTPAFRLVVHGADIIWPTIISLYGSGQRGPFFLFFIFVLL